METSTTQTIVVQTNVPGWIAMVIYNIFTSVSALLESDIIYNKDCCKDKILRILIHFF